MKKIALALTAAALSAALLAGCGSRSQGSAKSDSRQTGNAAQESSSQNASATASNTSTGADSLIIYFDYSENMGDTSSMDTDAVTSASLAGESYKGISKNDLLVMKDEIQKQTGADVYSVQVTDPYDPDYGKMVNAAQDDQNDNKKFSFKEDLPDLSTYQTIYLGMPVWWGQLPQPMASFLDQNDLSGKTIIPFGIHLGSQFGRMVEQISELEPDATVSKDGLTINSHTANDKVVSSVDDWLKKLGR